MDKKERGRKNRGAHIIGWLIEGIAVLMFIGAAVLAAWDGVRSGFGFWNFFVRFLVMLYCMEIYDILFFDWFLLCRSNFFPHFHPEVKGIVGPHMFGYNKRRMCGISYSIFRSALQWRESVRFFKSRAACPADGADSTRCQLRSCFSGACIVDLMAGHGTGAIS